MVFIFLNIKWITSISFYLPIKYDLELDSELAKIKIPHGLQNWLHNDSDFILEQNKVSSFMLFVYKPILFFSKIISIL